MTSPSDPVARAGSYVFGGPVGRRAAVGRRGWTYAAAMLSAGGAMAVVLSVLQKSHCVRSGWGMPGALWRGCYSDLPLGAVSATPSTPWSAGSVGASQPPLTAILTWLLRLVAPGNGSLHTQQVYFAIAAGFIALCVAGTVIATASMLARSPWLAAHVALSPVLVTASLVSFDLFGVALATIGMALWWRRMPLQAGLLLGAATMARTYPLMIVAAMAIVALRERRRPQLVTMLVGFVVAAVVVLLIAYAVGGDPLAVYRGWNDAGASYGSPWLVLQIVGLDVPARALTAIAVLGWGSALLVGGYLATRREHPVPLAPIALTMLVIVMITGKSLPVQAGLWVLPLIALCALTWREHLTWAGVEILYFAMTWMYAAQSANPGKALPSGWYAYFVLLRLVAYALLAWFAWNPARSQLNPRRQLGDSAHPR